MPALHARAFAARALAVRLCSSVADLSANQELRVALREGIPKVGLGYLALADRSETRRGSSIVVHSELADWAVSRALYSRLLWCLGTRLI